MLACLYAWPDLDGSWMVQYTVGWTATMKYIDCAQRVILCTFCPGIYWLVEHWVVDTAGACNLDTK
jgi:hypothetical protein